MSHGDYYTLCVRFLLSSNAYTVQLQQHAYIQALIVLSIDLRFISSVIQAATAIPPGTPSRPRSCAVNRPRQIIPSS